MAVRSGVMGFEGEAFLFCLRGFNLVLIFSRFSCTFMIFFSSRIPRLDRSGPKKTTFGLFGFSDCLTHTLVIRGSYSFLFLELPERHRIAFAGAWLFFSFFLLLCTMSSVLVFVGFLIGRGWHAQNGWRMGWGLLFYFVTFTHAFSSFGWMIGAQAFGCRWLLFPK